MAKVVNRINPKWFIGFDVTYIFFIGSDIPKLDVNGVSIFSSMFSFNTISYFSSPSSFVFCIMSSIIDEFKFSTTKYSLEAPTLLNIRNYKQIMSLNKMYCPIFCNYWVMYVEIGLKYFFRLLIACSVFYEKDPMCLSTPKVDSRYFWHA